VGRTVCSCLFVILMAAMAACSGANPSATPILPTGLPPAPVPPTLTPAGLSLGNELKDELAGFSIRYPDAWQSEPYPELVGYVLHDSGEPIDAIVGSEAGPSGPTVMLVAGPLDEIAELTQEAKDARAMAEQVAKLASGSDDFRQGETWDLTVGGEPAAAIEITWTAEAAPLTGRYVAVRKGEQGYVFCGFGPTSAWMEFVPTLETMLNSVAFFEPGVVFSLTETYQGDGYSIRYPEGWQISSAEGRVFLVTDMAILEMEIPSFPAIVIESGPLADLTSGQMAGARNARQMIEAFAQERRRDQGSEVAVGKIQALSVSGWYGVSSTVRFSVDGVRVADLITAVYQGDRGFIVHGYGQAADLTAFTPLYTAMIKSLILAKP